MPNELDDAPERERQEAAGAKDELDQGYVRLELALVEAAIENLTGVAGEGTRLVSAESAIKLLALRRQERGRDRSGDELPQIDPAALRQTLGARISAVRRATATLRQEPGKADPAP